MITALLSASKSSRFVWSTPRNVALILAGYIALHFALRLVLPPTLGIDDAEQALFAQQWLPSYRYRAPPLFTWSVITPPPPAPAARFPGCRPITAARGSGRGLLLF